MAVGTGGVGAVGSPGAPQPDNGSKAKSQNTNATLALPRVLSFTVAFFQKCTRTKSLAGPARNQARPDQPASLQDVAAQVLILDNVGELLVDVRGIDLDI